MVVDASSKGGPTVSALVGVFSDFVGTGGELLCCRLTVVRCLRAAHSRPAMHPLRRAAGRGAGQACRPTVLDDRSAVEGLNLQQTTTV